VRPSNGLAALVAVTATLAAVACGGDTETVTVTETVTETVTVAPEGPDDPAFRLSDDICSGLPWQFIAPILGARAGDSERLADTFAELARPELREPAREGCLAGLEDGD
jgi:hypothetical protein